jgi:large subunit ribosomal protein L18
VIKNTGKKEARLRRHARVRRRVKGTPERLRLSVFKSNKHIYAQIVDDVGCRVLAHASTLSPDVRGEIKGGGSVTAAKAVGVAIAKKAVAQSILKVVFDRGGYIYHGRIKALADAARENGLQF